MVQGCQTCLRVIRNPSEVIYINSGIAGATELPLREKLLDCVPELILESVEDVVLCHSCVESLSSAYEFKQTCLETQQKIHGFLQQGSDNTRIDIGKIAVYYQRMQIVARGGDPTLDESLGELKKLPYNCTLCQFGCVDKCVLRYHEILHKNKAPPYKCSQCFFIFPTTTILLNHLAIHTNERPYACTLCNFTTAVHKNLKEHASTHQKSFQCSICWKRFSKKYELDVHLGCHDNEEFIKRYQCGWCDFKCDSLKALRTHWSVGTHQGEDIYMCKVCRVPCRTQPGVMQHMRFTHNQSIIDTDDEVDVYEDVNCDFSDDVVVLPADTNTPTSTFVCSKCDAEFKSEFRLKKHFKNCQYLGKNANAASCDPVLGTSKKVDDAIFEGMNRFDIAFDERRSSSESYLSNLNAVGNMNREIEDVYRTDDLCRKPSEPNTSDQNANELANQKTYLQEIQIRDTLFFKCVLCGYYTTNETYLRTHIKKRHDLPKESQNSNGSGSCSTNNHSIPNLVENLNIDLGLITREPWNNFDSSPNLNKILSISSNPELQMLPVKDFMAPGFSEFQRIGLDNNRQYLVPKLNPHIEVIDLAKDRDIDVNSHGQEIMQIHATTDVEHRNVYANRCKLRDKNQLHNVPEYVGLNIQSTNELKNIFLCQLEKNDNESTSEVSKRRKLEGNDTNTISVGKKDVEAARRIFQCSLCPETRTSRISLRNHRMKTHFASPQNNQYVNRNSGENNPVTLVPVYEQENTKKGQVPDASRSTDNKNVDDATSNLAKTGVKCTVCSVVCENRKMRNQHWKLVHKKLVHEKLDSNNQPLDLPEATRPSEIMDINDFSLIVDRNVKIINEEGKHFSPLQSSKSKVIKNNSGNYKVIETAAELETYSSAPKIQTLDSSNTNVGNKRYGINLQDTELETCALATSVQKTDPVHIPSLMDLDFDLCNLADGTCEVLPAKTPLENDTILPRTPKIQKLDGSNTNVGNKRYREIKDTVDLQDTELETCASATSVQKPDPVHIPTLMDFDFDLRNLADGTCEVLPAKTSLENDTILPRTPKIQKLDSSNTNVGNKRYGIDIQDTELETCALATSVQTTDPVHIPSLMDLDFDLHKFADGTCEVLTAKTIYKCPLCPFECKSSIQITCHLRIMHTKLVVQKTLQANDKMNENVQENMTQNVCSTDINAEGKLDSEVLEIVNQARVIPLAVKAPFYDNVAESVIWLCVWCFEDFETLSKLYGHLNLEHQKSISEWKIYVGYKHVSRIYRCLLCPYKTTHKRSINRHSTKPHESIKTDLPAMCYVPQVPNVSSEEMQAKCTNNLNLDVRNVEDGACEIPPNTQSNLSGTIYKCPLCSFEGETTIQITCHFRIMHTTLAAEKIIENVQVNRTQNVSITDVNATLNLNTAEEKLDSNVPQLIKRVVWLCAWCFEDLERLSNLRVHLNDEHQKSMNEWKLYVGYKPRTQRPTQKCRLCPFESNYRKSQKHFKKEHGINKTDLPANTLETCVSDINVRKTDTAGNLNSLDSNVPQVLNADLKETQGKDTNYTKLDVHNSTGEACQVIVPQTQPENDKNVPSTNYKCPFCLFVGEIEHQINCHIQIMHSVCPAQNNLQTSEKVNENVQLNIMQHVGNTDVNAEGKLDSNVPQVLNQATDIPRVAKTQNYDRVHNTCVWLCVWCSEQLPTAPDLYRHLEREHQKSMDEWKLYVGYKRQRAIFKCRLCPIKTRTTKLIQKHVKEHEIMETYLPANKLETCASNPNVRKTDTACNLNNFDSNVPQVLNADLEETQGKDTNYTNLDVHNSTGEACQVILPQTQPANDENVPSTNYKCPFCLFVGEIEHQINCHIRIMHSVCPAQNNLQASEKLNENVQLNITQHAGNTDVNDAEGKLDSNVPQLLNQASDISRAAETKKYDCLNPPVWLCAWCSEQLPTANDMHHHLRREHQKSIHEWKLYVGFNKSQCNIFKCRLCPFKTRRLRVIQRHITEHEIMETYLPANKLETCASNPNVRKTDTACNLNSFDSNVPQVLNADLEETQGKDTNYTKLDVHNSTGGACQVILPQTQTENDENVPSINYKCPFCLFVGEIEHQINCHIRIMHSVCPAQNNTPVWLCAWCSEQLPTGGAMFLHLEREHQKSMHEWKLYVGYKRQRNIFKCLLCPFETRRLRVIQRHITEHEIMETYLPANKLETCASNPNVRKTGTACNLNSLDSNVPQVLNADLDETQGKDTNYTNLDVHNSTGEACQVILPQIQPENDKNVPSTNYKCPFCLFVGEIENQINCHIRIMHSVCPAQNNLQASEKVNENVQLNITQHVGNTDVNAEGKLDSNVPQLLNQASDISRATRRQYYDLLNSKRVWLCAWCSEQFPAEYDMHLHLEREHQKSMHEWKLYVGYKRKRNFFKCRLCLFETRTAMSIQKHIEEHEIMETNLPANKLETCASNPNVRKTGTACDLNNLDSNVVACQVILPQPQPENDKNVPSTNYKCPFCFFVGEIENQTNCHIRIMHSIRPPPNNLQASEKVNENVQLNVTQRVGNTDVTTEAKVDSIVSQMLNQASDITRAAETQNYDRIDTQVWLCAWCLEQFPTALVLYRHLECEHLKSMHEWKLYVGYKRQKNILKCRLCPFKTRTIKVIQEHIKRHEIIKTDLPANKSETSASNSNVRKTGRACDLNSLDSNVPQVLYADVEETQGKDTYYTNLDVHNPTNGACQVILPQPHPANDINIPSTNYKCPFCPFVGEIENQTNCHIRIMHSVCPAQNNLQAIQKINENVQLNITQCVGNTDVTTKGKVDSNDSELLNQATDITRAADIQNYDPVHNICVWLCAWCSEQLPTGPDLYRHLERQHQKSMHEWELYVGYKRQQKIFKCRLCPFKTRTPKSIQKHIKDHEIIETASELETCILNSKVPTTDVFQDSSNFNVEQKDENPVEAMDIFNEENVNRPVEVKRKNLDTTIVAVKRAKLDIQDAENINMTDIQEDMDIVKHGNLIDDGVNPITSKIGIEKKNLEGDTCQFDNANPSTSKVEVKEENVKDVTYQYDDANPSLSNVEIKEEILEDVTYQHDNSNSSLIKVEIKKENLEDLTYQYDNATPSLSNIEIKEEDLEDITLQYDNANMSLGNIEIKEEVLEDVTCQYDDANPSLSNVEIKKENLEDLTYQYHNANPSLSNIEMKEEDLEDITLQYDNANMGLGNMEIKEEVLEDVTCQYDDANPSLSNVEIKEEDLEDVCYQYENVSYTALAIKQELLGLGITGVDNNDKTLENTTPDVKQEISNTDPNENDN